ncbi:UNVERIFIED_CONTAM: hypothetical protein FKN15_021754 [Acipenser sinensis]
MAALEAEEVGTARTVSEAEDVEAAMAVPRLERYPIFENPYPLSIHESPVTCCEYFADCPVDLIPALYSVGSRQKRQGYSKKEWPVSGGNWGLGSQSYPEIIITGHADGSIKFWDASATKMSRKLSLPTELKPDLDIRDNSFSRSRSSSVTSIDKESQEAITSFQFCETFTRKTDSATAPSLWVGTTLGTVLVIVLNLPPAGEQRLLQPVIVLPSGTMIRLKGAILRMSFLDSTGALYPPACEPWHEPSAPDDKDEKDKLRKRRPVSISPSASQEISENQYAVICSEKQAKVIALPSQNCIYKHNITETSFVLRADMVQMSNSICLACFCANGHIMTLSKFNAIMYSCQSGKLLEKQVKTRPDTTPRITGLDLKCLRETEVLSPDTAVGLEMLGELFTPVETPEAPNRGFFKGLFGGGAQSLDREELFGESVAGKASRSLAQHIPGPGGIEGMKGAASGVVGDLARARIALDERGQKLGELEERAAAMMASADSFSKHAHGMMLKCKDKKWYQF